METTATPSDLDRLDASRVALGLTEDQCGACRGHLDTTGHVTGCPNDLDRRRPVTIPTLVGVFSDALYCSGTTDPAEQLRVMVRCVEDYESSGWPLDPGAVAVIRCLRQVVADAAR